MAPVGPNCSPITSPGGRAKEKSLRNLIIRLSCLAVAVSTASCAGPKGQPFPALDRNNPNLVYCCGGPEVFLIDIDQTRRDPAARLWFWKVEDSPQIRPEHRAWFEVMDECKPLDDGAMLLVSASSGGGIAVIRVADKACAFYASGRNAHSIAMIQPPGMSEHVPPLYAGAFSLRTDELRLYLSHGGMNPRPEAFGASPVWQTPLLEAHGAVWDVGRGILWALGAKELLKIKVGDYHKPAPEILSRHALPGQGGHDLVRWDANHLALTVWRGTHLFDLNEETFAPLPGLADKRGVKGLSRHPKTGRVLFTQAARGDNFTDQIQFLDAPPLKLSIKTLYKARWSAAAW